jgi:hypothetical protein
MDLRRVEEEVSLLSKQYSLLCESSRQLSSGDKISALPELATFRNSVSQTSSEAANGDCETSQNQSAREILDSLETLKQCLYDQQSLIDKFRKRLDEKDPVTEKPRYGDKTRQRVVALIQDYESLMQAMQYAFGGEMGYGNGTGRTIVDSFRDRAAEESEEMKQREQEERARAEKQNEERQKEMERARIEADIAAAERARQELEAAQALRRQAEEAREAIRREQEAAVAADRAWIESIPNRKTLEGVQTQLRLLADAGGPSAVSALQIIFRQIVSHPEEPNYRRIRRDHPRFLEDIGQYTGGKEVLVAAGFELGFVEEGKFFRVLLTSPQSSYLVSVTIVLQSLLSFARNPILKLTWTVGWHGLIC